MLSGAVSLARRSKALLQQQMQEVPRLLLLLQQQLQWIPRVLLLPLHLQMQLHQQHRQQQLLCVSRVVGPPLPGQFS